MTDPCTRQDVTGADGARLVGCAHGGQLLSWTPAGSQDDRLWTSDLAHCGPGLAIRGGIPVIFPQFADRGPLPKHGLARDRPWRLQADGAPGPARFAARLADDEQTRLVWPYAFELDLTATAAGAELTVVLGVSNPGPGPIRFTAALHSYLRVGDSGSTVTGLAGRSAEDNAAGGAALVVPAGPLAAREQRDLAVREVTGTVRLDDPRLGPVELAAHGFADRVIWNPGSGHGLADVRPGAESGFVCLEPAALQPVALAPGERWQSSMTLRSRTHK